MAFTPATDFSTGHVSTALAIGDIDGDGDADVVTANYDRGGAGGSVTVMRGDGRGSFGPPHDYQVGDGSSDVAIGDVDGDGQLDVVVANDRGSVTLLRNLGEGLLGQRTDIAITASTVSIADFDGDKRPDLLVGGASLAVLRNMGGFRFAEPIFYAMKGLLGHVAVSDVNGDGFPDVAALNASTEAVAVFINQGTGVLAIDRSYATDPGPWILAIGDVDRDGHPELLVATNAKRIDLFAGLGSGRFANSPTRYVADPSVVNGVALVDLDDDKLPEMVIPSFRQLLVRVNEDSGGRFQTSLAFGVTDNVLAIGSGDFDGDSKADLVAANAPTTTISVLLNRCQ